MAVTTIGPNRPVSTIANHTEREAGAIVTLVAIGLMLANAFVWLVVLAGS